MRVAVVGAGVSGLAAAHELALGGARVTVYEKEDCLGGHARTVAVEDAAAGTVHLDLGFMVFNRVRTIHCSPRRSTYGVHGGARWLVARSLATAPRELSTEHPPGVATPCAALSRAYPHGHYVHQ
jgi:phytoene dehydrogenase-like protein